MAVIPGAPEGMSFHTQCIARVFSYYFLETVKETYISICNLLRQRKYYHEPIMQFTMTTSEN